MNYAGLGLIVCTWDRVVVFVVVVFPSAVQDQYRNFDTVKLCYNKHGYNEFMATASKWQLHISFTSMDTKFLVYNEHAPRI
jgi:hypothetical protein